MDWQGWSIQGSPPSETPGSPDLLLRPKTPDFDDFPVERKPTLDDVTRSQSFEFNTRKKIKEEDYKSLETRNSPSPVSSPVSDLLSSSSERIDPLAEPDDSNPHNSPSHVPSKESETASSSSQPSQEQTENDCDEETSQMLISDNLTEKTKKELNEDQRVKMQLLVAAFSEDQLDRYEVYRRSSFPKSVIKRFMQSVTGGTISQNVVIAMSGVAKVYVGEIVEKGLDVMNQWGDTGPLRPKHIREAARKLKQENKVVLTRVKTTMFR